MEVCMNPERRSLLAGVMLAPLAAPAYAQGAPQKIGLVTTLSGPGGYIGQDIRDGFQLALAEGQGRLGGQAIQLLVEDDGQSPPRGKAAVERMLRNERVRLMTGVAFSNVLVAVAPDVLDVDGIYISANTGPSAFAGRECHRNYYVVTWQSDTPHEASAELANQLGYRRMSILAPNFVGGRDALAGFRRVFRGEVVQEIFTRLDQTDFAPEMAQLRAARPDAVFHFHPGGLGIAFLRQYAQAGLGIPQVLPNFSMDVTTVAALGAAAEGVDLTSHWNSDFDNPANRAFVPAYRARYNRPPTYYAQQGYDTALSIAAALRQTGGSIDPAAFRTAMLRADFASVRGKFRFASNQHPIQDWYAVKVERVNGELGLVTKQRVFTDRSDVFVNQCRL